MKRRGVFASSLKDHAEAGSIIIVIVVPMMTAAVPIIVPIIMARVVPIVVVAVGVPMPAGMVVPMAMAPTAMAIAVPGRCRSWESQSCGYGQGKKYSV